MATAVDSTATINTWTWVCHYSLWFDENVCAPSVRFCSGFYFAKLCTQREPAWYSVENVKLRIPVVLRISVCGCVCEWIGLSSQRLANRCMSHVRKSDEKYNLWLCRWSFFFLSLHSVAGALAAAAGWAAFHSIFAISGLHLLPARRQM